MAERTASTRTILNNNSLKDGVPAWMFSSARDFIHNYVLGTRPNKVTRIRESYVNRGLIQAIERYLQTNFPFDENDRDYLEGFLGYVAASETQCLDVLEAIVATAQNKPYVIEAVNKILIESDSKWIARDFGDRAGLEERVDETTEEAFNVISTSPDNVSSGFLKTAWSAAFGRSPNASEAYGNAIKAVEASAWPIILPNNQRATLGNIIREIKNNPEKWTTHIEEKRSNIALEGLMLLMQTIWDGQTDRHGTAHPKAVQQEAAEQAIFIALAICGHFTRSYVKLK
jgi:hypothetical protein